MAPAQMLSKFPRRRRMGKKPTTRGYRIVRRQMPLDKQIYRFKRTCMFTRVDSTSSGLVDQFGSYTFDLNDVPNVGEFTSLFDMYRIKYIKMTWFPTTQSVSISGGGSAVNIVTPRFITVVDYDDNATPTSQEELFQFQSCKITTVNKKHVRFFKPKVAHEVYRTAVTSGYGTSNGSMWIDCNNPDVPHYGLKWCMESAGSTAPVGAFSYKINVEYYLEFKNVR